MRIEKKEKANIYSQFLYLSERSFKKSAKDTLTVMNFVKYLFLSFLIGGIFFQTPFIFSNLKNILGLMFYTSFQIVLDPIFSNIVQFSIEFIVIRKERMSKMYRLSAYLLAKIAVDLLFVIIRPTIVWTIIYFMSGLSVSWFFIPSLLVSYIIAAFSQSIGLFIGSFGLPYVQTLGICSMFITIFGLFGGMFNNNFPMGIKWCRYISPIYYSFTLQTWIQLLARNGLPCQENKNMTNNASYICFKGKTKADSEDIFPYMAITVDPYYFYFIIILVTIFLYVSTYYILRYTLKNLNKKRKSIKDYIKIKPRRKHGILSFNSSIS